MAKEFSDYMEFINGTKWVQASEQDLAASLDRIWWPYDLLGLLFGRGLKSLECIRIHQSQWERDAAISVTHPEDDCIDCITNVNLAID